MALTVACQSFEGSKGGIARVCELTAKVALEADYPLSLLSVQNEGGVFSEYKNWRGFDGRRSAFVWACVRAAQSGARLLYDQLGTARAHLWPMSQPSGVWIHGIEVWTELRTDRLKAAKRMNYILANSHFTQYQAIRSDKTFSHARVCWLATLEDDVPEAPADLDGAPVVTIIGRLDNAAYKGHQELIAAWPDVNKEVRDAELIIIGTGPQLDRYRRLAAESPAANNIKVLGFVPDKELSAHWKRTSVFAMPSRGEGFGLTYIEAMRWGIPVIASVHDAGQEVNVDEVTGVNVNLDRKSHLTDALIYLLRDRAMAARMGAAGQRRWREHFCYSAFRNRFLKELSFFNGL